MRAKGISYSTGFVLRGVNSRTTFDADIVRRELQIIRDDLHCTAVRVMGGDARRVEVAATIAADLGLEVWVSPYPLELDAHDTLSLFAECARVAEELRQRGASIVLVMGAELSLMNPGFLPGDTLDERVALLRQPAGLREAIGTLTVRINAFLAEAIATVRRHYTGPITYASTPLERVDWDAFDFLSVDLYRSSDIAQQFVEGVRSLVAAGKPVAITEFGSATYRGAGDHGALGGQIIEYDETTGWPSRLTGDYVRDEDGQAAYITELLEIFEAAGVDSAFVFTFALYDFPHVDGDPRQDLDLASYGIVKVLDGRRGTASTDLPWEPKAAFHALGEFYAGA